MDRPRHFSSVYMPRYTADSVTHSTTVINNVNKVCWDKNKYIHIYILF